MIGVQYIYFCFTHILDLVKISIDGSSRIGGATASSSTHKGILSYNPFCDDRARCSFLNIDVFITSSQAVPVEWQKAGAAVEVSFYSFVKCSSFYFDNSVAAFYDMQSSLSPHDLAALAIYFRVRGLVYSRYLSLVRMILFCVI